MQQASLRDLFAQVRSSEQGLSGQEAQRRLAEAGFNEPVSVRHLPGIVQFLRLFLNPLVAILLIASFISALLGDVISAVIIDSIVLLSLLLNYFQTSRSQRAVEQLRAGVALTANVLRDGAWQEVPRRELVPGDVIRLQAGDLIPADARLLQATDLHVQQAALTGESMPVEKVANEGEEPSDNLAEASNSIFLGASVVSGTATALVVATGQRTAFGDIALHLARRPPETEFERGIKHFSFLIMQTVFFLVFFILLIAIARVFFVQHGRLNQAAILEAVLFAISLAVGLTPEFLPMITTVTLGQGALRMAKRKVIVKHLESIQNFGSIDVLCSDKTGTLTTGQTALIRHLDLREQPSERILLFAYLNSFFETGIKSPFDAAILQHERLDVSSYVKLGEIPFDFERRRLSVVVAQTADGGEARALLITKGAPESVLQVCSHYEVDGTQQPLDGAAHEWCKSTYQRLSAEGFRLLAVAYRPMPKQASYHRKDEQDLILLGFLAFADPPKEGVAEALQALRRDGVQVKILTGDNELVARHVCSEVGLDGSRIVLGSELEHMSDSALASLAEQVQIFARVSPAQKNRIIMALKSRHHVVGFLGDGINDAPSLHAADVGISVADGVEVAKEAAAIILLEQSLQVLHDGIIEGRKAFGNVIKYLLMGTSSNFGNMFSMAGAFLFLPFLPMLPTQILLNNFLYDLSQVTIPTDNVDPSFVRKPQRWNIRLIRDFMLFIGPISSIYDFLTFFVMLAVFHASEPLFHTGWFVESLATQTLVLFIIRTAGNPLRSRPSRPLAITISLIVCIGVALPFTPLAGLLGFVPLPPLYFLFLVGVVVTYLGLVEVGKRLLMRRHAME
ncbi:MAG: magnesium-translocating P-type ATPase [Ktedonobacteraceae bacterium]|nr:magnesium-translocating P-type ATPase [Ktedonobacteraceae bacterium]